MAHVACLLHHQQIVEAADEFVEPMDLLRHVVGLAVDQHALVLEEFDRLFAHHFGAAGERALQGLNVELHRHVARRIAVLRLGFGVEIPGQLARAGFGLGVAVGGEDQRHVGGAAAAGQARVDEGAAIAVEHPFYLFVRLQEGGEHEAARRARA